MKENKRCILLADDEVKMVRAISDLLKANGYKVIEAYDGEQAIDKYYEDSTKIDLILLDVMMPKKDGFAVLSELRKASCLVPIIMVTAREEEYDQLKGFNLGSDDYIAKPFSPSLLMARIEAVLKRTGKGSESEISFEELKLNVTSRTCTNDNIEIELTKREFDLLHFFINNKSRIFTREQILNNVWGYEFEGDIRTVDTHIKQIRIKLDTKSAYIKTVHRVGYKFEE